MRKTTAMSTITVLIVVLCAFVVRPQTKPNLTGVWKMNPSKSQFVGGSPKEMVFRFDQKDSSITESSTITNDRGQRANTLKYTIDSKEASNTFNGAPVRITAKWEDNSLIVEMTAANQTTSIRKITPSPGGKLLTIAMRLRAPDGGTIEETWVLDKQ